MPFSHLLLALAVVAVWGTNFVVIKGALAEVPPLLLATMRFALSALPWIFFIRRPAVAWRHLVRYGVFIGFMFGLLFLAMRADVSPGLASLLMQSQVFFTLLLVAWLQHEHVPRAQLGGIALATLGFALIGWQSFAQRQQDVTPLGLGLALAGALCWACGNVVSRSIGRVDMRGPAQPDFSRCVAEQKDPAVGAGTRSGSPPDKSTQHPAGTFWPQPEGNGDANGATRCCAPRSDVQSELRHTPRLAPFAPRSHLRNQAGQALGFMVWSSVFATLPLLALSLVFEGWAAIGTALPRASLGAWAAMLWQSLGNTLFAFGAWGWLLARHPAATITPMALLIPFFGMGASALLLGEPLQGWKLAAAALVIGGLALNMRGSRRSA